MLAILLHTQSNPDLAMEASWLLFNPMSHGMHTQGFLSANPIRGTWFSRHPLSMHNPTEKRAPCDSDLPSCTVVHRLTLGEGFKHLPALGILDSPLSCIRNTFNNSLWCGNKWVFLLYWQFPINLPTADQLLENS